MQSKLRLPFTYCTNSKDRQKVYLLILSLGILVSIGTITLQNWENIVSFPWQFRWINIVAGALTHLLALGTLFFGWYQMMRRLGRSENWRRDFEVYSFSILARRIPTPIWYIGSRLYLYREYKVAPAVVLSATGLETVLIAMSGIVCYLLFLPFYRYAYAHSWSREFGVACLLILLGALMLFPNFLIDITNWVLRLLGRPRFSALVTRMDLVTWETIYLSTWLLDGISLYLTVSGLVPAPPPLVDILGVSTVSALVSLATLALPAGLWLKELTMSALLSVWMPLSVGITIAICYRLMHTLLEMLWAFLGYWIGRSFRADHHK